MTTMTLFGFEVVMTALFLFTIFSATRGDATPGFAAVAIGVLWIFIVAPIIGGVVGWLLYRAVYQD